MRVDRSTLVFSEGAPRTARPAEITSKISPLDKRKTRSEHVPINKKIPGLEISDLTTEQLELYVSLTGREPDSPTLRAWKIRATHVLAIRFMSGNKAYPDRVKAYNYAAMEIKMHSIAELEDKFFSIGNINIVKAWRGKIAHKRHTQTLLPPNERKPVPFKWDKESILKFIKQTRWNEELNQEKELDSHGILLAWDKQLAAARLAEYYKKRKKETRDIQDALAASFYKQIVIYLREHETPDSLITAYLKQGSPWINRVRLFLLRLNKLFSQSQINSPLFATPFLKIVASVAGLYFLIELLIDIGILFQTWLFDANGRFDPSLERLKLAFWEDSRPSRMANAALWFAINLACFILTFAFLPIAPVVAVFWCGLLTVMGCAGDVGIELGIGAYSLLNINKQRIVIDGQLAKLAHINEKATPAEIKVHPHPAKYQEAINQKIALLELRDQLIRKRVEVEINRAYIITIMVFMLIAAALIFFPPAGLPTIALIAAGSAFIAGSILAGIGKHIFWNAPEYWQATKDLFSRACDKIKRLWRPKEKQSFVGESNFIDDQEAYANTKAINKELQGKNKLTKRHSLSLQALALEPACTPTAEDNYLLRRSPSGLLFTTQKVSSKNTTPVATPVIAAKFKHRTSPQR